MMGTIIYAYLLAYALDGNQFSIAGNTPNAKGVESRIVRELGPCGTLDECQIYADGQRKAFTVRWNEDNKLPQYKGRPNIPDYRLLKYQFVPIESSTK